MRSQDAAPRSRCPITFSLETFGDGWSLLILRDIIYFGKRTYGEFIASEEHIARNILANRLERLQRKGLLTKRTHPHDRRKDIYEVTEAGLGTLPILLDMADWGTIYGRETTAPEAWLQLVRTRRGEVIATVRATVRAGGSIFAGKDCVFDKLTGAARTSSQN